MAQYTSIDPTLEIHYPTSEMRWPVQWRSRRRRKIDLEANFWRQVKKDCLGSDCWIWQGSVQNSGYGQFFILRTAKVTAHRFSWFLEHGYILGTGKEVCHRCNNKLCVNPSHLYAGTKSENMRDAYADGLLSPPPSQGENNGRSKLTWEKVTEICYRYAHGETNKKALGHLLGVTDVQIGHIVTGKQWRE